MANTWLGFVEILAIGLAVLPLVHRNWRHGRLMRSSEAFISGEIHGGGLLLLGPPHWLISNIWRSDSINLCHFLMGQRNPGLNERNLAEFL
jgi:hypothetical protein